MQIKYFGHSCFIVHTLGKSMLFDPFITPNPLAAGIDITEIKPDFVLISHGHSDHIEDAPAICKNSGALTIGNWEVMSWMEKQGVTNVHPMNTGGVRDFDFGKLQLVHAEHSSTMPDGSTGGNPVGFVIKNAEDCFYYAGDTALFSDMKLIPRRFKIKVAFLPIGSNFTMDIYDAIEAAKFVQCSHVIGMHYDTFGYIKIDHQQAIDAFGKAGIRLDLMQIGQTIEIN